MVRARGTLQSSESTDPSPLHARLLRVQPKSEIISNDVAAPVVSHHSLPKCVVLKGGFDQTSARSAGGSHLSSSGPTLALSEFPCNRSVVFVSSATLLSAYADSSMLHRPVESAAHSSQTHFVIVYAPWFR